MSDQERLLARAEALIARLEQWLPPDRNDTDWGRSVAFYWRKQGDRGYLQPVRDVSSVRLDDLHCIDRQKHQIDLNTRQFLAKLPANHVLLWGPRGTGKSSLIKALLSQYSPEGLRLVEVDKRHLSDVYDVFEQLYRRPERFIVFCDDLSFEASDGSYKDVKVALDGSVNGAPENVLVFATSNRRHLMPEPLSDNLESGSVGGEIHPGESVDEKLSLSERFGLWLAFHPFQQDEYLKIVFYWLAQLQADLEDPELVSRQALQWALLHGSRSGRSAWQFARDWAGKRGLERARRG